MKSLFILMLSMLAVATGASAAPEDFNGGFEGEEKTDVTNCSNPVWNGVATNKWSATHEVSGTSYTGKGKASSGSEFKVEGQIAENAAPGTVEGTDKWGNAWSGDFNAMLEGRAFKVTTKGTVPASGCSVTADVNATKS